MLTGTAAQQSNSKASTVELAIDYIRTLQGELQEVKEKLQLAEQKLAKDEGEKRTMAVAVADGDAKTKTTTTTTTTTTAATMTNGDGDGGNDDGRRRVDGLNG